MITKPAMDIAVFMDEPNTWSLGYNFMYRNWEEYRKIFQFGRCSIIMLGCLMGYLLYRFGVELWGRKGGLLALFLYVFNPNIIAHSRLTTIDIGASCAVFFSIYCLWRYLKRKDLSSAILAGVALGLAQLSKFTALLLYPIFLIIIGVLAVSGAFLSNRTDCPGDAVLPEKKATMILRDLGFFSLIILISILLINAGYLFSGSLTPLADYQFLSEPLKKIASLLWGALPVPFPYEYLCGFDSQLAISAGQHPFYANYLMGEHSLSGWWYYYIIAFIVKNPLALLIVILLTLVFWVRGRQDGPGLETWLCIWAPVAGLSIYLSFFSHVLIGIRLLLPIFPLLFLAAGYLCDVRFGKGKAWRTVMVVLVVTYLIPAISIFPNYLSYFNFASGGPGQGHYWMIDSNLDWGGLFWESRSKDIRNRILPA
ncbi:MAG: glycosyltransferase family 39 protein [Deltaproteobacteria bacterium]|nr:glycosyltransferase family 39 protein [Deltaproteobacteria bacterium]